MGKEPPARAPKGEEVRLKCFARVRPTWPGELLRPGVYQSIEIEDNRTIRLTKGSKMFEFDKVFDQPATQEEVFNEVAVPLVENAFQGFHGTLFCYGQTGTGKTHTISCRTPGEEGIIPRAIDYIYEKMGNSSEYHLRFNYVQLYRDNIEDLLQADPQTGALRRIDLWRDETLGSESVVLKDLATIDVKDKAHFYQMYDVGFANKTMAETAMNANSSRGHALLLLHIIRRERTADLGANASLDDIEAQKQLNGKLIFADLAGYERIKKSLTSGIRKDEATSINLSLTALGNVIHALTNKASHIPWRNSKLTRLLQDALGGNSLTAVIVTMNSVSDHITETVNTLYFGYNAMQCKTTKRLETGPMDYKVHYIRLQAAFKVLEAEKRALEDELESLRSQGTGQAPAGGAPRRPSGPPAPRDRDKEIEGYLGVIDEARGALETEAERAAGLQKQVAELTTALEEKDLEEAAFYDEVQSHLDDLTAQLDGRTRALAEKTAEVERLLDQVAKLNAENEELAEGTEDFIRENEELQAALATQKTIIQSLQRADDPQAPLLAVIADLERTAAERAQERQRWETRCGSLEQELARLREDQGGGGGPEAPKLPTPQAPPTDPSPPPPAKRTDTADPGAFGMQDQPKTPSFLAAPANPILSTLLEQLASWRVDPQSDRPAVVLVDSDDDDDVSTATHTTTTAPSVPDSVRGPSQSPAGMVAMGLGDDDDDDEEEDPGMAGKAAGSAEVPQVRWLSWNAGDPAQSHRLWSRILEEVHETHRRGISYHTTMKDVSEFLAEEHRGGDSDGSDAGEATEASPRDQQPPAPVRLLAPEIGHNPLEDLPCGRRPKGAAPGKEQSPEKAQRSPSTEPTGHSLHVNSQETIAMVDKDPTWPRVSHPVLRGRLTVDSVVTAQADYCGGVEGDSRLRWYRVFTHHKTGAEVPEAICENKTAYKLVPQDVGCFLLFEYVPVRKDGAVGPAVVARSPTPITAGAPSVKDVRIEGEAFALQTLWVSYKYIGAEREGETVVRWFKSIDGYVFYEINKSDGPSGRNGILYLSADLTHHYIRVLVVPVSYDGTRGKPTHSKLIYVNVDEVIDRSIRDLILKGEIAFNVRAVETKGGPEQPLLLHMDGKKLRVCRRSSADKAPRLLFALHWSDHLQMLRYGATDNRLLLREVHKSKGSTTTVRFTTETSHERDLLLLAFRAFYTMAQPNVTGVMLGDAWKDWTKGKWKERAPEKRAMMLARQLALEGPRFEKYHVKHRPGSLPTFFHRMEELFIEGELDLMTSTKNTKKPHPHRLPFPLD